MGAALVRAPRRTENRMTCTSSEWPLIVRWAERFLVRRLYAVTASNVGARRPISKCGRMMLPSSRSGGGGDRSYRGLRRGRRGRCVRLAWVDQPELAQRGGELDAVLAECLPDAPIQCAL